MLHSILIMPLFVWNYLNMNCWLDFIWIHSMNFHLFSFMAVASIKSLFTAYIQFGCWINTHPKTKNVCTYNLRRKWNLDNYCFIYHWTKNIYNFLIPRINLEYPPSYPINKFMPTFLDWVTTSMWLA